MEFEVVRKDQAGEEVIGPYPFFSFAWAVARESALNDVRYGSGDSVREGRDGITVWRWETHADGTRTESLNVLQVTYTVRNAPEED